MLMTIHSILKQREPENDLLLSLQKVKELNFSRFQEVLLTSAKNKLQASISRELEILNQ